jgi:hypothetical protein
MKPLSFVLAIMAPGLLAGTLAACSAWQEHEGQEHTSVTKRPSPPIRGPGASAGCSGAAGSTGSGPGSYLLGAGMTSDLAAMCELNRRIMGAPTPVERQAMIDRYLPGMSSEMREQRLQTMRERCR